MSYLTLKIIKGSAARHKKKPTKFCDPLKACSHIERQFFFFRQEWVTLFSMKLFTWGSAATAKEMSLNWFCTIGFAPNGGGNGNGSHLCLDYIRDSFTFGTRLLYL